MRRKDNKKINPNLLFLRNNFNNRQLRIYKHQGGTRSGKTFNILMFLIELCYEFKGAGIWISICRKTFPALRATVYRDFIEILERENLYDEDAHNKTEQTYTINGNTFEFFGIDQPAKVRGRKRDILYVNEANEIPLETWRQLVLRTSHKIIVDYNPSDAKHYIYDLDERDDCIKIVTTYKDNPHLSKGQIEEIELLKDTDPDYWTIFGLGEIGAGLRGRVFTNWVEVDEMPNKYSKYYGMDFGFSNDPTALIEIEKHNKDIWLNELIYDKQLTSPDIAEKIKALGIRSPIYCDPAAPMVIEELRRMGINAVKAEKGAGSIMAGINKIKGFKVHYTKRSINLGDEYRMYKYKMDLNGQPLNEPIDKFNHLIDAARYGLSKEGAGRMRAATY